MAPGVYREHRDVPRGVTGAPGWLQECTGSTGMSPGLYREHRDGSGAIPGAPGWTLGSSEVASRHSPSQLGDATGVTEFTADASGGGNGPARPSPAPPGCRSPSSQAWPRPTQTGAAEGTDAGGDSVLSQRLAATRPAGGAEPEVKRRAGSRRGPPGAAALAGTRWPRSAWGGPTWRRSRQGVTGSGRAGPGACRSGLVSMLPWRTGPGTTTMAAGSDVCGPLLTWLQTFAPPSPCASPQDLATGVPLAHALHCIDPSWFNEAWLGLIREDAEGSWRLKFSNLRKVLQRMEEYWEQVLGSSVPPQHLPDLTLAAQEGDPEELSKLLRLALSCAICCQGREEHIQSIMALEESVQLVVMAAIQELLEQDPAEPLEKVPEGMAEESYSSFDCQSRRYYFLSQEEPPEPGGAPRQRYRELEQQVLELREENRELREARGRLEAEAAGATARKLLALQAQVEQLQEENYRLESGKEELRARCQQLERQSRGLQERAQELSSLAGEARALRDEMDTLRAVSARAGRLEAAVAAYRGRAAGAGELRRWGRALEERLGAQLRRANALQAQLGRAQASCQQLQAARRQLAELSGQQALAEQRAEQCQAELRSLQERFEALSQEKERLRQERDALREANEELRCQQQADAVLEEGKAQNLAVEMLPAELRETVAKLRQENLRLLAQREQLQGRLKATGTLLGQEELFLLEEPPEELEELNPPGDENESQQLEELQWSLRPAGGRQKVLEPPRSPPPALHSLRSQLREKEALIRHLQSDLERSREQEELLLVRAWYRSMGLAMQQQEEAKLRGTPPGGAESFLAQQRLATVWRRARNPRGRPPPK